MLWLARKIEALAQHLRKSHLLLIRPDDPPTRLRSEDFGPAVARGYRAHPGLIILCEGPLEPPS
jgi:hypothetical protein